MLALRPAYEYQQVDRAYGAYDAADIQLLQRQGELHDDALNVTNSHGTTLKAHATIATRSSSADDFLLPRLSARETKRPTKQRLLAGWRAGALASFIGALSVCLFNLAITIWVWKGEGHGVVGSIGTLFRGECRTVRNLNVWIHLLVNTLSTLLLCASNYCMQILSAPNRQDIAKAHAKQTWLNIGVPSLHNLIHIHRFRSALWVLLVFSSLPLHLLFNSVVFTNLQANEYKVVPTTEDFLHGAAYNTSGLLDFNPSEIRQLNFTLENLRPNLAQRVMLWDKTTGSKNVEQNRYRNVSTADCFNQYGGQYLSAVGNVWLVQDGPTVWRNTTAWFLKQNSAGATIWERDNLERDGYTNKEIPKGASLIIESLPETYPADVWRCSPYKFPGCDVDNFNQVPQDRSKWALYERPISYCMVEQVQEFCQLQFSFIIALVVIGSNFVKVFVMGVVFFKFRSHIALVTLGDAIASFLDDPDPHTRGCCLITKTDVEDRWKLSRSARKVEFTDRAIEFEPVPHTWSSAPDYTHWLFAYMFYLCAMIFGGLCIGWTMKGMPRDPAKLWKVGFGTVNGNNLVGDPYPLMSGVLLANTPQALLSYLYLAFNSLYTNMFIGREWASYLNERKSLRVTSAIGQQRNTYWLNVPFRFAIPMTIISGIFHWLASQSFFLVRITLTTSQIRDASRNSQTPGFTGTEQMSTCGYSPFAIILTTVTGTLIAIVGILIGRIKYPTGMPLVGNCSAAISAACHRPLEDVDASLLPVQWGAVSHGDVLGGDYEPVGHCSFTSLPVEYPREGQLYA